MENYKIYIHGANKASAEYEPLIEEAIADNLTDYLKDLQKEKDYFDNLGTEKEVHSLKEYFSFLNEIDSYTNGEYHICNNGRCIDLS